MIEGDEGLERQNRALPCRQDSISSRSDQPWAFPEGVAAGFFYAGRGLPCQKWQMGRQINAGFGG